MKWISFFFLASTLFVTSAFSVYKPNFKTKVIYGDDNRLDLYQVQDMAVLKVANSTAAVFQTYSLEKMGTLYRILGGTLGAEKNLCPSEPYFAQPSTAFCSAFLVGADLVATAGHCIEKSQCATTAFAFGYAMRSEAEAPTEIPEEDVYFCKEVVKRENSLSRDYAVVQLDRIVRGRDILKLASQPAQVGEPLTVIGHPSGLPTKVADGAVVRNSKNSSFTANLDTYAGNSGSAVFNSETLEVQGILVSGETDYVYDSKRACYKSNVCPAGKCSGETATQISFVTKFLNTTYLD